MAVIDVVIFDNSGSMSGRPMEAAYEHAAANFAKDTEWRVSDGKRLMSGRMGDADGYRRICQTMGPATFHRAIAATCAPGVRLTVYTDEIECQNDEGMDPFAVMAGREDRVVLVGCDAEHLAAGIALAARRHPDVTVDAVPNSTRWASAGDT